MMFFSEPTNELRLPTGFRRALRLAGTVACFLISFGCPAASRIAADEPPAKPATELREFPIDDDDREHWSFRKLMRPALPSMSDAAWTRNAIDYFILAQLRVEGLTPQPEAPRRTLIRRLKIDLLGLPPTVEEVRAFVNDRSPRAYERLVDRFLASPFYGDRWGQHWLDLARFAETDGFEHDKVRPNAWRYRDWVIQSLNRDMPYDEFVRLQLAGDEFRPGNTEAALATTFCLSGPDMPDINSQEERRHNLLNEMTATVGEVFMALQMGCCQCHDHKFDPLSQADFYRLRAVFAPAVKVKKNQSVSRLRETGATAADHLMIRGDWRRRGPRVPPGFPRIANHNGQPFAARKSATTSGRRAALADWLTSRQHPLTARVIANRIWQHHFGRGLSATPNDFGLIGQEPTHPGLLDWLATSLMDQGWSLKRLHREIVTSATYRQRSRLPQSAGPKLTAGWRRGLQQDPSGDFYWRYHRRRLEGEVIRDAMLFAAGVLNTKRGGPGVRPQLSPDMLKTLLRNQWVVTPDKSEHDRRSVFIFARRNLRYPIFDVFDRPSGNCSCGQRARSTTASQSLLLINSQFSLTAARRLAGRVLGNPQHKSLSDHVSAVVRLGLGRPPTKEERHEFVRFVREQDSLLVKSGRSVEQLATPLPWPKGVSASRGAALSDLCLAIFNINEFIYVD